MLISKLRQSRLALAAGVVTVGYPLAPRPPDPGFRGRVVVDTERCVGCGGCAPVCPSRCVLVTDLSPEVRVIRRRLDRCIQCGRCERACAYAAIRLAPEYELGTTDRGDLWIEQHLFMGVCGRCGRCALPIHPLDGPVPSGWRADEPALAARTNGNVSGAPATATAAVVLAPSHVLPSAAPPPTVGSRA